MIALPIGMGCSVSSVVLRYSSTLLFAASLALRCSIPRLISLRSALSWFRAPELLSAVIASAHALAPVAPLHPLHHPSRACCFARFSLPCPDLVCRPRSCTLWCRYFVHFSICVCSIDAAHQPAWPCPMFPCPLLALVACPFVIPREAPFPSASCCRSFHPSQRSSRTSAHPSLQCRPFSKPCACLWSLPCYGAG